MIEIKNITIKYGDFTAVRGVSFTINDGEFFTLLGPSGCGKTTTLRAIAGFEPASEGEILVDGKNIAPLSPEERGIGFVFQNYALFPSMTVFNNIAFGLKIKHIKREEVEKRVRGVAEMTGIEEHLPKKISELSGGQQQRVAIARALILNPRILLMDEPLSNLDAKLRVSMRGEIRRLQKRLNIAAIYVTHDQEEAMAVSDKIAVFNKGVIEQTGTPKEIYRAPATEFAARFVGDINAFSPELVKRINSLNGTALGDKCYVRTEKVRLLPEGMESAIPEGDIRLEGTIASEEYLGAFTKYRVAVGGDSVLSLDFCAHDFEVGQRVTLSFAQSDALSF